MADWTRDDRAVSEVLSYVLVFSLVASSVAVVSVVGIDGLQNARDAEQLDNAERAFDVLADNVADLHQRGAPSRATEVSLSRAQLSTGEHVVLNVSVTEQGDSDPTPVLNRTIRPIVYTGNQDRRLVYEAGAVFRENRDNGLLVRPPPLLVDDERVLLTVVSMRSDGRQSLGGSTVLVRTDHRGASVKHADASSTVENVTVRVASPRAGLWASYFEDSGFDCNTPGSAVTCWRDPSGTFDRVYVVDHDVKVEIEQ